jgi:glutaredoxin 1
MIIIYGQDGCSFCEKAIDLAIKYELDFQYRNISQFEDYKKELLEAMPEVKTVPQIWWYDRHIGGYTEFAKEVEETRNYGDGQI